MKKKVLSILLAFVAIATTAQAQVVLNAENFPDANFRKALAEKHGISEGDEITKSMIWRTSSLYIDNKSIADLTGIEHFTALTTLTCSNNQLTSLDVSQNTALEVLYCDNNQLNSLDVSGCAALYYLKCQTNQLTSLDVSGCTALKELECYSNQIKDEAMDVLVASLPTVESSQFYVINVQDANEGNICMKSLVAIAKEKGWTVYDYNGSRSSRQEYEGFDPNIKAVVLNAENFPDANFRAALASIFGISEGDEITAMRISATYLLFVPLISISDLTGIEHFTALKSLYCYDNQLTSLDVSGCTALKELYCYNNQLTSLNVSGCTALTTLHCYSGGIWSWARAEGNLLTELDVSGCTNLTDLRCHNNQLKTLNVSGCTALLNLTCYHNQLTSLDVSDCTVLSALKCDNNQLTSLNVSKNTALTSLYCFSNQIKGEAMDALVGSLPTVSKGNFYVIDTKDENEGNVCTKSQVAVAKGKGWTVYDVNGQSYPYPEYEGSDPVEEDINPVDEDDNIDFGSDMDENDNLNGNIIGDIFYNIGNGNGEYNAEEGCIVLKKTTDDETVDGLSGKDIFGEDFKGQFTGIVFKVPAGKGTVKVTAETTGNMLLKVKIGDGDPVEMELNGKLKISFPYNVSETTFVAIYAGANNEAKGLGTTNATKDAALKIYGIEFERDNTTAIGASLNDNEKMINDNYYSIDGKKLNGEPTKKGVYIVNGKKIVK